MPSPMEKILGARVGEDGSLPGTVPVAGKEFRYFSDDGRHTVRKQFDRLTLAVDPPNAKFGGATSQRCKLLAPDNSVFHGLSYHGDLEGWRRDVEEGARILGLLLGRIEDGHLVLSDGRSFSLGECRAIFG